MKRYLLPGLLLLTLVYFCSCNGNGGHLINGKQAPDLALPDSSGKMIDLKAYRGKLVLIDFWASWCKPCRKENPYLVQMYDKFHGAQFEGAEGFEIISVSLDSHRGPWVRAIAKDNLHWSAHVSELNGWKSKAVGIYGITSIPTSFLLDQNGMIIGKDLRVDGIEKLLNQRVK